MLLRHRRTAPLNNTVSAQTLLDESNSSSSFPSPALLDLRSGSRMATGEENMRTLKVFQAIFNSVPLEMIEEIVAFAEK